MKVKKIFMVSLILLTILCLGAVSAADNATADDLAVEDAGAVEVPVGEEISVDGDAVGAVEVPAGEEIITEVNASYVAVGDNVTDEIISDFKDDKLSASQGDENLSTGTVMPTYTRSVDLPMQAGFYYAQWGQPIVIHANFTDATGNVTLTFAGQTYTTELVDGAFTYEITKYSSIKREQLRVTYSGDDYYASVSFSFTIFIGLNDVVVNSVDFGQTAYANVNLYDATGNVTFTLNGITYRKELVNGTAVQELKNYNLGSNSVSFAYEGDDKYNSISKSLTLTTTANITPAIFYNFQPAIISVDLGQATGNVNFTWANETQTVGIVNGIATFEAKNYVIGDNSVDINYSGDDTFKAFSTTHKFTILEKENATILASVYKTANKNMVVVCIPYATGNVTVAVNGKKEVLKLVNGIATQDIDPSDVITEVNVTYGGDFRFNPASSSNFINLENNVVNNDNYMYYFNQAAYGKLFEFIEPGTTLDFQGSIINPNQSYSVYMDVSIPVNIISTTGDAFIDLNATGKTYAYNEFTNSFYVTRGGSGSNITGINFHNTHILISNATHVVLDKLNIVDDQKIAAGALTFRSNSSYITLKNSYFYGAENGGSAAFTFAWATNCTLDNNTFVAGKSIGYLIYYYTTGLPSQATNLDNNFTNNLVYGENGIEPKLQFGSVLNENNTFIKSTLTVTGNFIGNIITEGGATMILADGDIVSNNYINAIKSLTISGSDISNNYIDGVRGMTLSANDALVYDNVINCTTTINDAVNAQIYDNTFIGDYTIKFNNPRSTNIIFSDNNVFGNIEFANPNAINNKIVNNTITTSANYAIDLKTYTNTGNNISSNILYSKTGFGNDAVNHADDPTLILDNYPTVNATINVSVNDIKVGETAVINVTANETSITGVDIFVNGKKYNITLSEGKGSLELKDLLSGIYEVSVISTDLTYGAQNSTSFEVSKNICPDILVDAPAKIEWIDSNITVTITDATGSVTLDINGTEFTEELVDGVVIFAVPDLTYGTYNFNVTYSGDYKYFGNSTNGTLTVNGNKEVKIIASDIVVNKLADKFVAKFTNYHGEGIANANVTITIGDSIYPLVTDENGTVIVDLALTRGKYDVNIEFKAIEDEYDAACAEYNITVIDASIIKIISVSEEGLITESLYDALGTPIANATIVATMNGTSVNLTTDKDGLFQFQAENGCKVTFEFAGDEITTSSDASITVNIKPTPKDTSIINIVSVDGTGLVIGCLSVGGNPIINATIVAIVNGSDVNLTTDGTGLFVFQAQNGVSVVFNYAGDDSVASSNASFTLGNVVHVVKESVITASSVSRVAVDTAAGEKGKAYTFTLKDAENNALANKTVKVTLNGNVYTVKTDSNGKGSVVISLNAAKKYNLNVFFMGDDDYKGSTAAAKITVTKKKTTLKAAKTKYTFKAKAKSKVIKATLKTSNKYLKAGKKVTIKIKGKKYTAKVGKKGAIKLNIKKLTKKGTYKAKIKFAGDSTYKASSSKTIKIVIK